jgi:hypothetical protein
MRISLPRVEPDELTPQPPEGYNYDLANAETIFSKIKIVDGMIVLNDQIRYRVLVLQNYSGITMQLLRKIHELVAQGMILVGDKPQTLLGLNEHRNSHEFERMRADLWDRIDGKAIREHAFGKGRVIWGETLRSVLQRFGATPDFEYSSRSGDAPVIYTHTKIGDAEIYFVSNQRRTYEETVCTFRIKNKQPELWDPATGTILPVAIYEVTDDRVRMPVQFEPYGSVFVVFRSAPARQIHFVKKDTVTIISTKDFVQPPRKLFKEVSDNFTVSFWAKPELNILLFPDMVPGTLGAPSTDYYAIYPSSGKQLYGEDHATCGITVGRNGVAVWEHCDIPLLKLAAETPISGWSHILVLYKNRIPSVYVNGKFIAQGQRSSYIMHPSIGDQYLNEGASYYNGDMLSRPCLLKF